MTSKSKLENLQRVKQDLAEKYTRKSKNASSKVKRDHFRNKAADYANQARKVGIKLSRHGE